jgi:hypothetical protein
MTRKQAVLIFLAPALPLIPAAADTKRHITFNAYISGQFGIQHANGPGDYSFNTGDVLQVVVTDTITLAKSLKLKNIPNGRVLLLKHIKDDRFELSDSASGQKASLKLALKK